MSSAPGARSWPIVVVGVVVYTVAFLIVWPEPAHWPFWAGAAGVVALVVIGFIAGTRRIESVPGPAGTTPDRDSGDGAELPLEQTPLMFDSSPAAADPDKWVATIHDGRVYVDRAPWGALPEPDETAEPNDPEYESPDPGETFLPYRRP